MNVSDSGMNLGTEVTYVESKEVTSLKAYIDMDTNPSLFVGQPLGVLQLGGERHLDLGQLRHLGLGLLQLAEQVGVLNGQLLLGGIEVVEGAVGFVSLALHLVEGVLELLDDLLLGSLFEKKVLICVLEDK